MTPVYRVSNLAAYARWKAEESDGIGWLHNSIFGSESTESMERGTAFHEALEKVLEGDYGTVEAEGYIFAFTCDAELYLPKMREFRFSKDYGGIIVTGQCDGLEGRRIIDHKTTEHPFDAESYLDSWQHRFYLDIFDADRFDWHVWEMKELDDPREIISTFLPGRPPTAEHASDAYDEAVGELAESRAFCVHAHHLLTQYRYPELEADCRNLAAEFRDFAARQGWHGIQLATQTVTYENPVKEMFQQAVDATPEVQ